MSKTILDQLEKWEQQAYDEEWGADWLEQVGEGFKFYIRDCLAQDKKATINGFMLYLAAQRSK